MDPAEASWQHNLPKFPARPLKGREQHSAMLGGWIQLSYISQHSNTWIWFLPSKTRLLGGLSPAQSAPGCGAVEVHLAFTQTAGACVPPQSATFHQKGIHRTIKTCRSGWASLVFLPFHKTRTGECRRQKLTSVLVLCQLEAMTIQL